MKQPLHHRRIRTSNLKGWTSNTLNELSELFVKECALAPCTALDIGAAHGIATIPALSTGAHLIANDSSHDHLSKLRQLTPPEFQHRLELLPGRFPRDTKLKAETLDLAHASNVFHFLTGRQIEQAAAFLEHALRPGGKVFILAATPYMKTFEPFIPTYESRVAQGDPWPGWITNVRDYSTGFRCYHSSLLKRMASVYGEDKLVEESGFVCMLEVLLKLRAIGARATEIPYVLRYDLKTGVSKLRIWRTLKRYLAVVNRYRDRKPEAAAQPVAVSASKA